MSNIFCPQTADDVPKLCHAIERYLSLPDEKRESQLAHFLTRDEFEKWVAEDVGLTLNEDEKKVAVEYLESSGIVSKYLSVNNFNYFDVDN